jgi:hypothetical protein
MSKPLIIRDEVFEYPTTGDSNYGEEASNWAEAVTDVLAEITGPGDIPTSEYTLTGTDNNGFIEGTIQKLVFDTSYVQSIEVSGFFKKTYEDQSYKIENFKMEGIYNLSTNEFIVSTYYIGDDTKTEIDINPSGQGIFSYNNETNIGGSLVETVTIKYSAKTKIDESFFE